MWGGTPSRNMVAGAARGLPITWDIAAGRNVRWSAELGDRTYGNPVVAGGKVLIGTNNGKPRNPVLKGDHGVLMCFAEADGRFLWQAVHPKLEPMQERDWPEIGLCSAPCVVGDRVYYISNDCKLICADLEGFADQQNDGPITNEAQHGPGNADFVWELDMHRELGVIPLFAAATAPVVLGDVVLVVTGNGSNVDHEEVPAPKAPSFIGVDRHSGKLLWQDASPGERIAGGQWSSPAAGAAGGREQAIFGGGDGWLYSFDPKRGNLLWKFNCRVPSPDLPTDDEEWNENVLTATPVLHGDTVYVAIGLDPENSIGPGCLRAIDATKSGDITGSGERWHIGGKAFNRSAATVAIADGLLYAVEAEGRLHCLDLLTGKPHWTADLKAMTWSSPLVADGKVYLPNQDGEVWIFKHGPKLEQLAVNAMGGSVYASPVVANNVIYMVGRERLYALADGPAQPAAPPATAASQPSASSQPSAASRLVVASRPTVTAAAEWPMFRGNAQLTGASAASLPDKPGIRWRRQLPEAIDSTAAIAGGRAFVGCDDGRLYCLKMSDGTPVWDYPAKDAVRSSPCAAGELVIVGDNAGLVHAIDAQTGRMRWTFRTEGEVISSPVCEGDRVLFGSYDGFLYCLNLADGRLLWKAETEGRIHGTPSVVGGTVFVAGCDEQFHMVNLEDGKPLGKVAMGSFSGASAAVSGSRAYVGTFSNQVLALDWATGQVAWRYEPKGSTAPFYGSAAVAADRVVIGGRDHKVHAIAAADGLPLWTFTTQDEIDASPVIVGQRAIVPSSDGTLYSLTLADGKEAWRFEAGSPLLASPAVADGCLVIGSESGMLYCLGDKPKGTS